MVEVLKKGDFVGFLAQGKGITKRLAAQEIEDVLGGIKKVLADHKSLHIAGFGKFESVFKPEHKAVNNLTGSVVTVPDHYAYKAKLSKTIA